MLQDSEMLDANGAGLASYAVVMMLIRAVGSKNMLSNAEIKEMVVSAGVMISQSDASDVLQAAAQKWLSGTLIAIESDLRTSKAH